MEPWRGFVQLRFHRGFCKPDESLDVELNLR
jgi:hypothetical protein